MADHFLELSGCDLNIKTCVWQLGDWMKKQLLNLVIPKYYDLSVSHRSINLLFAKAKGRGK